MQELLKKFCLNEKQNGLLLFDMPTGTGKTHNAVEFIYNNYEKCKGKIIYVTSLKKNLPKEDLKKLFQKDKRLQDYEKDVLFIDNNVDNLIENFESIQNKVPEIFYQNGIFHNIKKNVSIIKSLKEALNKNRVDEIGLGGKENLYFMIQQAKDELTDKYEKEFRTLIEQELQFNEDKKKRTKKEKLNLIKNDETYSWIGELYPSVFTDEKKIVFMSIDKLLVRNTTLIEPSYQMIDSRNLFKNSWLFIDEFDISKDVVLNNIIKESIGTKMGVIELFRGIYNGYNTNFSHALTEVSSDLNDKIASSASKIYTSNELLKEFQAQAERINEKYNLENFHKLDLKNKDKANFLFQDYKFHTIFNDRNSNIFIENDKDNQINWIKNLEDNKTTLLEEENIFFMLQEINSFLTYFQNGVKFLADNYMNLKKDRNQETNNFSYEASVKTVLSEFGLEGRFLNYLTAQILNIRKKREYKIGDLKSELDTSIYEKGFRYYHFIDNDAFDTQSKINYLAFSLTPEKLLIYLAKITKIIGISASGTLETVTGNYDLDYIKSKLEKDFFVVSAEDSARINTEIHRKLGNYKKVNIEINKCDITEENYLEKLNEIIAVKESRQFAIEKMDSWSLEQYVKCRYTKLFYAMQQFFEKKINSYLFLTNVTVKSGIAFNYNFIQEVFSNYKNQYGKSDDYCYFLEGSLEKFETLKREVKEKLKSGKRIFLVSSYQTLGSGQNLQYEFNEDLTVVEEINDNLYGDGQKDFDAIFLDKPTNLFVNINNSTTEEQLLKFIYQIKSLEQVGHFTLKEADERIKQGFKITYHSSPQKIATPKSRHIWMHTAKVILQAIGRICRTKNKNSNIVISFDINLEKDLASVKNELLSRPLNHEFKKLLEACNDITDLPTQTMTNVNNSKARKCFDMIENMRAFKSTNDIKKWEELREIVLKHPTDNCGIHNQYDIYCELDVPSTYYHYSLEADKEHKITADVSGKTVSESVARLDKLMTISAIKEFFIEQGYATSFEKSKYIILPPVFNKIYLGALGEAVGEFLINRLVKPFNLKLERITDTQYYEKFDFVLKNELYVDFKHWTGSFDKEREKEVNRIINKLNTCQGKNALIINILKPDNYSPEKYVSPDNRLIIIPYLYDFESKTWNSDALAIIKKAIITKEEI